MSLMMQAMMAASRRRVTLDPDALDYFSRAEALGGSFDQTAIDPTYGEAYVKGAISDMIAGLKADAVWSKITELYLLTGVSFGGLMAKVKHAGTAVLTNVSNNFVAADYLAAGSTAGLRGKASTYIDTGFADSGLDANNKSFCAYVTQNSSTQGWIIGASDGSDYGLFRSSSGACDFGNPFQDARINGATIPGFFTSSRRGVNDVEAYRNGATFGTDTVTASRSAAPYNWTILGDRDGSLPPPGLSIAAGHVGSGLTSTEATNLSLRINALMTALGCNVYANPTFDPDAADYFARIVAAGSTISDPNKLAVDAFVKGCKADGIWSAIKASCILAGADTLAGALVPLVGAAPTNNNFVAADYSRTTGLVGDGSTKYLNSNKKGDSEELNSYHMAAWQTEAASIIAASTSLLGDTSFASIDATILAFTSASGNALIGRNRNSTVSTHASASRTTIGFFGNSRATSSEYILRGNGTNNTFNISSNSRTDRDVTVFARQSANLTDARLSFYSIGESLNLALLDARLATLMSSLS